MQHLETLRKLFSAAAAVRDIAYETKVYDFPIPAPVTFYLDVQDASVTITIFFTNREPAGPYRVKVPARRALHLRFDELTDPEPVPRATPYASIIESDVPIVVQHTRLDSRQAENALLSSIAFPGEE